MAARTRMRSRPRRRVYAGLTLTLFLQLTMASATAPLHVLWVHTPALSLSFDAASGAAISANGSTGWRSPLHLATTMNSSSTAQKVVSVSASPCDRRSGSVADSTVSCVEVKRTLSVTAEKTDGTCCALYLVTAVDRYSTRGTAIEWQSRLSSASPKPWRTGITRSLALDMQTMGSASWWIASAKSNASDPLRLLPPSTEGRPPASLSYGGESFQMYLPAGSVSTTEVLPTPISVHGVTPNGGLGLVVSLNETILAASVAANSTGVRWTRHFDRMGVGRELGEKGEEWGSGGRFRWGGRPCLTKRYMKAPCLTSHHPALPSHPSPSLVPPPPPSVYRLSRLHTRPRLAPRRLVGTISVSPGVRAGGARRHPTRGGSRRVFVRRLSRPSGRRLVRSQCTWEY